MDEKKRGVEGTEWTEGSHPMFSEAGAYGNLVFYLQVLRLQVSRDDDDDDDDDDVNYLASVVADSVAQPADSSINDFDDIVTEPSVDVIAQPGDVAPSADGSLTPFTDGIFTRRTDSHFADSVVTETTDNVISPPTDVTPSAGLIDNTTNDPDTSDYG